MKRRIGSLTLQGQDHHAAILQWYIVSLEPGLMPTLVSHLLSVPLDAEYHYLEGTTFANFGPEPLLVALQF